MQTHPFNRHFRLSVAALLWLGGGCLWSQTPAATAPPPPAVDAETQWAEKMAEAQQRLKKTSATDYTLGDIQINAATRELRLPCVVLHQQIPIEYILVHETGKDHETILTTAIAPLDLQVALLLANYTPGSIGLFAKLPQTEPQPFKEQEPKTPGAHRAQLTVEWTHDGQKHSSPLSQWIQNSDLRVPPPDLNAWIFNGSKIDNRGFVAEAEGSFIAVYADANALFNSPAEGNHRDDIWISLPKNIPPEGTPVTLIISPAP